MNTSGGYIHTSREHSINSHPMSKEDDMRLMQDDIEDEDNTPKLGSNYIPEEKIPLYS
jgi:hypothetical protein